MNFDFSTYSGNLRVTGISFDALAETYSGNTQEYDPSEKQTMRFYIGKIGKYVEQSYFKNEGFTATVQIEFSNGYVMIVDVDGVVSTDEEMTWNEFLPEISDAPKKEFSELTEAEKKFADSVILQLIASGKYNGDSEDLVSIAVGISIRRTLDYGLVWKRPVFESDE